MADVRVEDIKKGEPDAAGLTVDCIYARSKPYYAVYRTAERVMVHFADDDDKAREQRTAISPLTPLRGQINALIDGWHKSGTYAGGKRGWVAWICWILSFAWLPCWEGFHEKNKTRAARYDRRVADAIVTGLENDVATALALLGDIKNDIISERTSIARTKYLFTAFGVAVVIILLTWLLRRNDIITFLPPRTAIWIATAGGTVGAFFSIAIGLKGRQLVIDLQNRDNIVDAILRVVIGAMSGGLLLCLLLSRLVQLPGLHVVHVPVGGTASAQSSIVVFVLGFFGGFFERLVPDLLSKTNLGTKEGEGSRSGTGGTTPHTPVPPPPPPPPPPPANGNSAEREATRDGNHRNAPRSPP